MMNSVTAASLTALWLGILTSISPCPLATNIAAISFIGKRIGSIRAMLLSGLVYTAGRMLTYVALAFIIVRAMLSIPVVSMFLQTYMNKLLGPVLIVAGMFLLELLTVPFPGMGISEKSQQRFEKSGILGAGILGMLFALTFCPVSAALFFGSLIPLSLHSGYLTQSSILYPSLYGIGTALPVIVFAFLVSFSVHSVGRAFTLIQKFERYARWITGITFILVGIYYTLRFIFGVTFY